MLLRSECGRIRRMLIGSALAVILIVSAMEASMASTQRDTPRDLNTHHLFAPPADRTAWEKRRAELRRQVLFSAGLWPMPAKTPLRPKVTGKIEAEDYTIENVALETRPGFYLCGNLYRPKGKKGPFPGIVNPHGHWSNGRLEMQPDVPKADPKGKMGEGRGNLVAIGVNLARQGFVVFAYDAVGYNDTRQVSHDFAKSLRAWSHGVSIMGLQLWDSIRVVDYLQSLKDVDRNRIGCTGASGGGSQTFLLTAVDDRVKVSAPVNMVSAHMQGGCLCENGPGLRVGTDNVEIAAMTAPRPMLLVACTGDWTKNNLTEEWPAIRKVYDLYRAGEKTAVVQFNYQHNYNVESREAMYAWFGKWLLNDPDPEHFREKPFTASAAAMRVWNSETPLPESALKEEALTESMIEEARRQLESLWPDSPGGLKRFRQTISPAFEAALGVRYPTRYKGVGGAPGERALLVVSTPERASQAQEVLRAAGSRYKAAKAVELPGVTTDEQTLWKSYFSTYNRTPLGDRVEALLLEAAYLESNGAPVVDIVGLGEAGVWSLYARALTPDRMSGARTVVDLAELDLQSEKAMLGPLYAPGIRRAGDIVSAAMLVSPSALLLFNPGPGLPDQKLRQAFEATQGALKIEYAPIASTDIVTWITNR